MKTERIVEKMFREWKKYAAIMIMSVIIAPILFYILIPAHEAGHVIIANAQGGELVSGYVGPDAKEKKEGFNANEPKTLPFQDLFPVSGFVVIKGLEPSDRIVHQVYELVWALGVWGLAGVLGRSIYRELTSSSP